MSLRYKVWLSNVQKAALTASRPKPMGKLIQMGLQAKDGTLTPQGEGVRLSIMLDVDGNSHDFWVTNC